MAFSVDMYVDESLREFAEQNIAPECDWITDEDVVDGYVNDLLGFLVGEMGIKGDVNISFSVVTSDRIHEMNREFRGVDAPTDVLSFPCDGLDDPGEAGDQPLELGDIVICPEVAFRQSREYGNTYLEEFDLLVVHSFLHLLGYDHIEDDEAEVMERKQNELKAAWERNA